MIGQKVYYSSDEDEKSVIAEPIPIENTIPLWSDAYLMYFGNDNGIIHMFELNTLINHLNVKKNIDVTKQIDYDPFRKIIK